MLALHHHMFFFLMIRRPPRSTLFPTRRSSDLIHYEVPQGANDRDIRILVIDETGTREVYRDRKSTRLNSSHLVISYAVFCLKKKTILHAHTASTITATGTVA